MVAGRGSGLRVAVMNRLRQFFIFIGPVAIFWLVQLSKIMNAFATASIVFGSLFGSMLLGMRLRAVLPPHHLSSEAKDSVRVAMASVATMAALVVGLLVASTKSSY